MKKEELINKRDNLCEDIKYQLGFIDDENFDFEFLYDTIKELKNTQEKLNKIWN